MVVAAKNLAAGFFVLLEITGVVAVWALLRLPLDMLGVKFKYVTGYRSSAAARLALQRNEINMYSESPPSYRSVIEPMANRGEVVPLWYDPSYDGTTLAVPKQVELPPPAKGQQAK